MTTAQQKDSIAQLSIWVDGSPTSYHLTIGRIAITAPQTRDSVQALLVSQYKHYFGRNNIYKVVVPPVKWGQMSWLLDLHNPAGLSVDWIRVQMFNTLAAIPGVSIDTSRYADTGGLPPQHVATGGKPVPFGGNNNVTFVIALELMK